MAVRKTYQVAGPKVIHTRFLKINVEVEQGGSVVVVPRNITMKGASHPRKKRGTYTTSDPAMIKAMDKRIENAVACGGKPDFLELKSENIPDKEAQKTPEVVTTAEGETKFLDDVKPGEVVTKVVLPAEEVGGITTVQDAKAYLIKKFEVPTREVANKELILKVAHEKNIVFTDL